MEPTAPSTARMIDHYLGGTEHHPIDVAAAQAFEAAYGPCAHEFRALRGFLQRSAVYLAERGTTEFLVLGAGVPASGNVHEAIRGARVLYTDIDPVTVEIGQRLLAEDPLAAYAHGDATRPGGIDELVLRRTLPGWGERPTGVIFLGLAAFFPDAVLAESLRSLHDMTVEGSLLAFDFDSDVLKDYPEARAMLGGDAFHMRRPEQFEPLLGPWRLMEPITPVADWPPGRTPGEGAEPAFFGSVAAH